MQKKYNDIENGGAHNLTWKQAQENDAAMKELLIMLALDKAHGLGPQYPHTLTSALVYHRREDLLGNDMFTWPAPRHLGIGDEDDSRLIMESLYLKKLFSSLWKNIRSFFTYPKESADTTTSRHPILLSQKGDEDKADKARLGDSNRNGRPGQRREE